MLYPAIVVSHPCDRKKSQGWGTELRGYSNHGSTLSGMGASRSRREARDWDLSLFVTMTRHPTRRLQARTAGRRPIVGLSPRAGAPAWTARVFYRFLVDPEKVSFKFFRIAYAGRWEPGCGEIGSRCPAGQTGNCAKKLRGACGSSSPPLPARR